MLPQHSVFFLPVTMALGVTAVDVDGYFDGHLDGYGHVDGHVDGYLDWHVDGYFDGYFDGHVDGYDVVDWVRVDGKWVALALEF